MDRILEVKTKVYVASLAVGLGLFMYLFLLYPMGFRISDIMPWIPIIIQPTDRLTLLFLCIIICLTPIAVVEAYESKMVAQVTDRLPVYFRDLVEMRKSGLSFEQCLKLIAGRNYGILTPEIQRMSAQIETGIPLRKVIDSFKRRVGGKLAKVTSTLLYISIDVGGGSISVLESLSGFVSKVSEIEKLKRDKARTVNFIMYFGQFILIMIIVILLSTLESISSPALVSFLSNEFALALLFQSVLVGFTAGALGSLKMEAGARHTLFLSSITFVFAKFFLGA